MPIVDNNGQEHDFSFETFYNRYEALTLAVHIKARNRVGYRFGVGGSAEFLG